MLNSYINIFENKISELEERFKVMVQKEDIEVKNIRRQKIQEIGKCFSICLIRVLEGKNRKINKEIVFISRN